MSRGRPVAKYESVRNPLWEVPWELGKEFWKKSKISCPTVATSFQRDRKNYASGCCFLLWRTGSEVISWFWMKTNRLPLAPTSGERAPSSCLYLESIEHGIDIPRRREVARQSDVPSSRKGGVYISNNCWKGEFSGLTHSCLGKVWKVDFWKSCISAGNFPALYRVQTPLSWGNPFHAAWLGWPPLWPTRTIDMSWTKPGNQSPS